MSINRYTIAGLGADAMCGHDVAVITCRRANARLAFEMLAKAAPDGSKIRRTNGQEQITYPGGGRITFRHAGATGLRGVQADVTYVDEWRDLAPNAREDAILTVAHGGELVRG